MKVKKRLIESLKKFYDQIKIPTIRIDNVKDKLIELEEDISDKDLDTLKKEVKECRVIFKQQISFLDDILYKDM